MRLNENKAGKGAEWIIECLHPEFVGARIDTSDLATGRGALGNHRWKGGYSGRPALLKDLLPVIRADYSHLSPRRIRSPQAALRSFWRYLDSYESWRETNGSVVRIDSLAKVTASVVDPWANPGPNGVWQAAPFAYHSEIRRLVVRAIELAGGRSVLFAPVRVRKAEPKDTATEQEGLRIIRYLRKEVARIFSEWRRTDALAKQGRDLLAIAIANGGTLPDGIEPVEADAHATFRSFVASTRMPHASVRELNRLTVAPSRKSLPTWWPRHAKDCDARGIKAGEIVSWSTCQKGAYPGSTEVVTIALLALARTGWNVATLLAMDYEDWSAQHDDEHFWLHAKKERSEGARQYSISRGRQVTGSYQIITRLIERSSPLRKAAMAADDSLGLTHSELRSPWLGLNAKPGFPLFVPNVHRGGSLSPVMRIHIEAMNSEAPVEERVRSVTPSDFRDIAAAVTYRDSRYNAWILMVMLGHKNMSTTRAYGFRHAARQESHRQVIGVVSDVLEQVSTKRSWDPALTRAKLEGIEITDAALERLEDYRKMRTYSGAVCRDPYDPPASIDPTHPKDGVSRCIQGHLCVARACPQATVLNDSLDDICKMLAELESKRSMLGMVRFAAGSEQVDMKYLSRTLEQWPRESVQKHLGYWREEIANGRHIPLMFAGQR